MHIASPTDRQRKLEIVDAAGEKTVGGEHVPAEGAMRRRDATGRRPDRGDVAKTCGRAHGATEIGAMGQRHHAGRDRNRGATGRSTRSQYRIERIARRPAQFVGTDRAEAEFGCVGLSQNDRASAPQSRDHEIVFGRNMIAEQSRSVRGRNPRSVGEVLDPYGHPMQRADPRWRGVADISGTAGPLRIDSHEGRQLAIKTRDPRQMRLDRVARGEFALREGACEGRGSEVANRSIRRHHPTMPNLAAKSDRCGHETCFLLRGNGRQHHG
ncbi:hypothetical protein ACVWZL_002270 [Bradyrhizobium sp. GM2.4]